MKVSADCLRNWGILLLELALAMLFISVALVGLLDGFRASLDAHRANDTHTELRLLLEEEANELERQGFFQVGASQGEFRGKTTFTWKTETQATSIPSLYRVKVTVAGRGEKAEEVVYLRARED